MNEILSTVKLTAQNLCLLLVVCF